jgi:hypothetical protein
LTFLNLELTQEGIILIILELKNFTSQIQTDTVHQEQLLLEMVMGGCTQEEHFTMDHKELLQQLIV